MMESAGGSRDSHGHAHGLPADHHDEGPAPVPTRDHALCRTVTPPPHTLRPTSSVDSAAAHRAHLPLGTASTLAPILELAAGAGEGDVGGQRRASSGSAGAAHPAHANRWAAGAEHAPVHGVAHSPAAAGFWGLPAVSVPRAATPVLGAGPRPLSSAVLSPELLLAATSSCPGAPSPAHHLADCVSEHRCSGATAHTAATILALAAGGQRPGASSAAAALAAGLASDPGRVPAPPPWRMPLGL